LFEGDPGAQVVATRDALLNYTQLMEDIGPTTYTPPAAADPAATAGAGAGED